jgi:cobalt-precorrin 5A hydrolase
VQGKALHIVPPVVTLGIGCRRGTVQEKIEAAWRAMCTETGLAEEAVVGVASIDLKKDEKGLQAFCREHGWPFRTYSAGELKEVPGEFTASELVKKVTGVDNVCERSAVLGAAWSDGRPPGDERRIRKAEIPADNGTKLIFGKHAYDGVTVAFAVRDFDPDFRWTEEEL